MPNVKEMLCCWSLFLHVFFDTWMAICDEDLSVKTISIQASHAPRKALFLHGLGAPNFIALETDELWKAIRKFHCIVVFWWHMVI